MIFYPKQIIYPLKYFKPSLYFKNEKNETHKFVKKFKRLRQNGLLQNKLLGRARSGFYLAIKSLVSDKKFFVLISPFTIHEVIDLIILAGGCPIFIDFEKESTNLDLKKIKKNIKNKKICAAVITHYSIIDQNLDNIFRILSKEKIPIIEDCALSYTSAYNISKKNKSDFQIYSFSSFKTINYFYGGLISYKKKYTEKINILVANWEKLNFIDYITQIKRTILFSIFTNNFLFNLITIHILKKKTKIKKILDKKIYLKKIKMDKSYFSLPSNAAVNELLVKVGNYKTVVKHRRKISLNYYKFLKHISIPKKITKTNIYKSDCFNYLVICKSEAHRDFINKKLIDNKFDTGVHFYFNCRNFSKFSKIPGETKNLNDLCKRLLILPTHPRISISYSSALSKKILQYYD